MKKALGNIINIQSLINNLRHHKWFLVKMMGWQPSLMSALCEEHGFCVTGLILETLSPGFALDLGIMLCFLFFTLRYVCSFGNKVVLCKAWSYKVQTLCPWWGMCTTLNLHNIFCPIESTWIKYIHAFYHFPGSCPQCSDLESLNPYSIIN